MKPNPSAKIESGDSGKFVDFMRQLVKVPHSEIKEKLDQEKTKKRTSKRPASHVPVSSSKVR